MIFDRALIHIKEIGYCAGSPSQKRDIWEIMSSLKKSLLAVPRDSEKFLKYQREIQRCRQKLQVLSAKEYQITVVLKDYTKHTHTFHQTVLCGLSNAESEFHFSSQIKAFVNDAIQQSRRHKKHTPKVIKIYDTKVSIQSEKPRIYAEPGQLLNIYVKKNIKHLYVPKKPEVPQRYVGLELEFCAPISENELAIKLFQGGFHKFVELKHDGSLRPKDKELGFEIAVLMRESEYRKQLKALLELLGSIGAVAEDRRCGLHVHIDMRHRNKETVYNNLVACQDVLMSLVDPSREDNEFCKPVYSRKFPQSFTNSREERYKAINAAAYYKYQTLEVRMHEGSLEYKQIINWIDLLIKISNYKKKMHRGVSKLTSLKKKIKIDKRTYSNLIDRSCFLQVNRGRLAPTAPERDNPLIAYANRLTEQVFAVIDNPMPRETAATLGSTPTVAYDVETMPSSGGTISQSGGIYTMEYISTPATNRIVLSSNPEQSEGI